MLDLRGRDCKHLPFTSRKVERETVVLRKGPIFLFIGLDFCVVKGFDFC